MQKHDDKHVYYYDNVSYISTEKYNVITQEELNILKEVNDWNQSLKEEKMVKRKLVNKYNLSPKIVPLLDYKDLQKEFNATVDDNEKISTTINVFDTSQTGQQLYYVFRKINKSTTGGFEYVPLDQYLMILNADGTYDPENYLIKIDDLSRSNEPLTEIKEKNDWVG